MIARLSTKVEGDPISTPYITNIAEPMKLIINNLSRLLNIKDVNMNSEATTPTHSKYQGIN